MIKSGVNLTDLGGSRKSGVKGRRLTAFQRLKLQAIILITFYLIPVHQLESLLQMTFTATKKT
jgi:hypothetical protein